ncbi:MAG: hypothetical protein MK106_14080 [Mariniblastus sp.]|nr:hypothetical protein [Mariniblastus sp.]
MRKMVGSFCSLVLFVVVLGMLTGWLKFDRTNQRDETDIEMQINREKLKEDTTKLGGEAGELLKAAEQAVEKATKGK